MSTKKETERSKLLQEKCQNLITQMLKDEDNKYCVDCDAKGPRWASWNLGVFLCIRCAGIHRNLGVHITRVKSVNLDTWTPEQVISLQQMGNSRARAVYEAQLPDGFRRPQTDAALESFIRAKYEQKKYVAKEWVPSPPPKVDWEREIDEELEKQKRKKKSLTAGGGGSAILGTIASPSSEKKVPVSKPSPIPAPLPKPKSSAHSPKTGRAQLEITSPATATTSNGNSNSSSSSNTLDLLGLSSPPTATASNSSSAATGKADHTSNGSGAGSDDEFNNFFSANSNRLSTEAANRTTEKTVTEPRSLAQEEADFFNQSVPSDAEKAKLTKDSIMALYGSLPTAAAGVPGVQSAPVVANSNPTSNLSLLAGLGAPITGSAFPSHFTHQQQSNGGFPTQASSNGLNQHFGGLNLGGLAVAQQQQQPQSQVGGQFGQMQSQFGGGLNQFNNNGHNGFGMMNHQGMPMQQNQQQQQQVQGINYYAGTGMGGFPPTNSGLQNMGGVKGGFNATGGGPQPHPAMLGGLPMMGGNSNTGAGAHFPYSGVGAPSSGGMPGNGVPPQMMMPLGGGAGGQANGSAGAANQFANLNLGNVWQ